MAIKIHLDDILKERNMTSKELCKKVHITEANLSILRSGKAKGVRFSTINKICYYLECDVGDILKFDGRLEEEDGIVDGWDDPRLVTITALRRRGYTASSIRKFMELCGVSKSNSSVDSAMLEYCIREDLKMSQPRMMAVLDPVKLVR